MSRILVTGGAGYIGSHTCVSLLEAGFDVVVVDNLSNSSRVSLDRVREITGKDFWFHRVELLDAEALDKIFKAYEFDAVVHFAAFKAVGESVRKPLEYYRNNVTGTAILLETMKRHSVLDFVFSSSATVYGDPASVPITEDFPTSGTNPYGWSKLMNEQMCRDLSVAEPDWRIVLLRYFNPIGAHESGRIGEDPRGIPNNLVPYIMQVAVGRLPQLEVFGDDYETRDGTGVRDYIHVMDLAEGHVAALRSLEPGCATYNLGTGKGYTVLELLAAAGKATGDTIPHVVTARRPGDIAECYADASLAADELLWIPTRGLNDMLADHWRWQSENPDGYPVPNSPSTDK